MNLANILKDKTIYICNTSYKNTILKEMTNRHLLLDVKFYTLHSFLKEYLFNYNEETLYYLMKTYHLKIEIALMYLNNLLYISLDKEYTNSKLKFLASLKKELQSQNLLIYNPFFKEYIKDYQIYLIDNLPLDFKEEEIFKDLKYHHIKPSSLYTTKYVYEFKNSVEEIDYVFKSIGDLFKKGISINKIKIMNITNDYHNELIRMAKFYHLPLKNPHEKTLYSTNIAHLFLKNLTSLNDALEKIKDMDQDIVKKIKNICNKYLFVDDLKILKEILIYEFKKIKINDYPLKNYLDIINIDDYIEEDNYIFLMNFNMGIIPQTFKDEDYLDDTLKEEINLKNTITKNKEYREYIINKIKSIKNLSLSYKLQDYEKEYYPSNLVNDLKLEVKSYNNDILHSYSRIYDQINFAKSLYNYETYGINNNLSLYLNTFKKITYNTYDNQYQKIDLNDLKEYLNNKLTLSYSHLSNYNKCAFRYYLTNIIGLNKFEETFETFIGSLFHDVLEKCLQSNLDIDPEINNYLKKTKIKLTAKENFYINKLKEEMAFVKDVIIEQNQNINLKKSYYEKLISIDKSREDMKINFIGFIDKILYQNDLNQTYIAIIDYKTGKTDIDLKNLINGLNMQLPIYLYLIVKSNLFKNPQVIGFYLQYILNKDFKRDLKKDYLELKKDSLKLVGYSTDNLASLKLFDSTFTNSQLIKGLKVKNDGNFYASSKVLNEKEMSSIVNITEKIIDEDIKHILNGDFSINPKKIGYEKIIGCEYCPFKDICFKKNSDYVILDDNDNLNFLGGNNA